jgi:hypothetical protein
MARSSYFHEIAPTVRPTPSAALAPAPPLFRPAVMPAAFLEVETLNAPRGQSGSTRAGAEPPSAHDQAQEPELRSTQPTISGAGGQIQFRARGLGQRIGRDEVRGQWINAPLAPTPPATPAAPPAMATTAAGAAAPQPTNEHERHHPAVRGDAAPPVAPQSIAPPAPAPARAAMPSPASVHIGTLEVRVVAPPATPQSSPLRPRIPTRAPPLPQARSGARLSRSFGVFGLGQS